MSIVNVGPETSHHSTCTAPAASSRGTKHQDSLREEVGGAPRNPLLGERCRRAKPGLHSSAEARSLWRGRRAGRRWRPGCRRKQPQVGFNRRIEIPPSAIPSNNIEACRLECRATSGTTSPTRDARREASRRAFPPLDSIRRRTRANQDYRSSPSTGVHVHLHVHVRCAWSFAQLWRSNLLELPECLALNAILTLVRAAAEDCWVADGPICGHVGELGARPDYTGVPRHSSV